MLYANMCLCLSALGPKNVQSILLNNFVRPHPFFINFLFFLHSPCLKAGDSCFDDQCAIFEELASYTISPSVNSRVPHGTSCPPSIAYANSADAPYIPSPKGRGFTALSIKKIPPADADGILCAHVKRVINASRTG